MRRTLRLISVLAAAAVLGGCGIPKQQFTELQTSYDDLNSKHEALQGELASANQDKEQLQGELQAISAQNKELMSNLESQKQETQMLEQTYTGLVQQLRGEVSSGKVEIQQMRDGVRVNLAQDILFSSGSARLDKGGVEVLNKVAEQLKVGGYQIAVIGHTDDQKIGPGLAQRYPTNWELGAARASSVVRLMTDAGIDPGRLLSISRGDSDPRAGNETPDGRAQNRRIEIRLRPVEEE